MGFYFEIVSRAAQSMFDAVGTTGFGWIIDFVVIPILAVLVVGYREGWAQMIPHWKQNLKDIVIVVGALWVLLYCYYLFYRVPHDISQIAYAIKLPAPPSPIPPPVFWDRKSGTINGTPAPRALKLIFTESRALTPKRKDRITSEMEAFYSYLVRVGFHPPTEVPPIGVNESGGSVGTYPGTPVYDQKLFIRATGIDDPSVIRAMYGNYAFGSILDLHPVDPEVSFNRTWTAWILTGYFTDSFSNTKPTGNPTSLNGWVYALWEIRTACGKDFTDRALAYAIGAPEPPSGPYDPQSTHFNDYFRERLARGEEVVDDAVLSGLRCTNGILNARRLGAQ